ncbi:MAG: TonB-dependent receptor [Bacteroidetes bacterium CG2_30_32_10]|nr:MAG: TonB-dependent receptor [Bacteroidetes bacterium CG2_30_32_10]
MMKKTLLLFAICLLTLASINAQTLIKGKIIDAKNNEELIGAIIMVEGTGTGTTSTLDGSFSFKVKPGDLKIEISFMGYVKQFIDVKIANGETKDIGTIALETDAIGLEEIKIVASFAIDRVTPISVSTISPTLIQEKLGSKEFPEILKSTPSVYATKTGGGYGDGRINLRGFSSNNIGVLINGVPVNDMESGAVYWSNWAGLSDVTRTMQVQRGLGASKLALSSVGGTINIITKSIDAKKGGSIYYGIGNDNYQKTAFTLSTGLMENGWAITANGSHTTGDGYIKGANFEGWSYFLNVAKKINEKHQLSYTVFGAPQWHNQRYYKHSIQDYRDNPDGTKLNTDYGYLNGKIYSIQHNQYHKPQMSVNHTWLINTNTHLSTAVYASFGRGGGRRIRGTSANWIQFQSNGKPYDMTLITPDNHLNLEAVLDSNKASQVGSKAVMQMDMNSHDWYGILSNLNKQMGNFNITAGVDGRFYKGYHYTEITDLLGGDYYIDPTANVNRTIGSPLQVGDKVNRDYIGKVIWGGLFGQAEYVVDKYSAFLSLAVSNTTYQRFDYFQYTPEQGQASAKKSFLGYSFKGGTNYNLNKKHNVFINAGYFLRAPYFSFVFKNYTNNLNEGVKPERVLSYEGGYGFRSKFMSANLTLYQTSWLDKALTRTNGNDLINITGLNAIHKGIELSVSSNPIKKVDVILMTSIGSWKWDKDVEAEIYDANNNYVRTDSVFAKGIHVGDAAQTTASLTINYEVFPKVRLGVDYNYAANLYAYFDIASRSNSSDKGDDAWKLPAYSLFDLNVKYLFNLGKLDATLIGNVDNIFDVEYLADATDGANHDAITSTVFYGFGRTATLSLKINF